jgi:hypothetical protein
MNKLIVCLSILLLSLAAQAQEPDQNGAVIQGNEDQHNGNEAQRAEEASDREAIDGATSNLQQYMDWLEARRNEWSEVSNFSPSDCAPDFGASSQAMMPSTCAGNQACSECYEKAVGELNFIRRQLGRLSCIYSNTKQFNESAIAFGDNMSGVHAVTGAAWQSARGEIVGQFESFKRTYDQKYTDMMGSLQRALQSISACEMQYGLPDWYQRFGFIYFEFMKDKYKRVD